MVKKDAKNCWDYWECAEQIRKKCPAYEHDMGNECWFIASSFDGEGCP